MVTLVRVSIIEALPAPVQGRLEDVVGLNSIPHVEFREYLVHAVEKYRHDELKLKEQDKNIQMETCTVVVKRTARETKSKKIRP